MTIGMRLMKKDAHMLIALFRATVKAPTIMRKIVPGSNQGKHKYNRLKKKID